MIHTLESWDTHWTHTSKAWDTVGYNNYKFWDTLYLQDCPSGSGADPPPPRNCCTEAPLGAGGCVGPRPHPDGHTHTRRPYLRDTTGLPICGCPVAAPAGLLTASVPRGGTRGRGMPPCLCVRARPLVCVGGGGCSGQGGVFPSQGGPVLGGGGGRWGRRGSWLILPLPLSRHALGGGGWGGGSRRGNLGEGVGLEGRGGGHAQGHALANHRAKLTVGRRERERGIPRPVEPPPPPSGRRMSSHTVRGLLAVHPPATSTSQPPCRQALVNGRP